MVRLRDEGGRHRGAAGHLRQGRRPPAGLPVHRLHDHADERRALGAGRLRRREPRREKREGRRAEHEPVVVQDGRHRAAAAHLQPVERPGPRDPAGRPDGLRGLAAVAGAGAGGPGGAPRRQRGRHRLPDLRRGPGAAREADAGADRGRPRRLRRGGPHRGRRLGPARLGEPGAPAAHLPLAERGERRPLPRAVARCPTGALLVAWRPAQAGERRRTPFAIHRFDPATGAREKVFEEAGLGLGPGEARGAPPDARRALERRARRRPRRGSSTPSTSGSRRRARRCRRAR